MQEERIYRLLSRILGTFLLTVTYYHEYLYQGEVHYLGALLVLILYLIIIWAPNSWWTEVKYFVVALMIISVDLALYYLYDSLNGSLIWPLFFMIVFMAQDYRRVYFLVSLITLTTIFFIYSLSFTTLLGLLGAFLVAQNLKIKKDAHLLTTLHLEELNRIHKELETAHNELHEANVYSVRYAALEERTRLAQEIHDGLGHQLTSLIIQLQALKIMQVADPARAAESINQLIDIARQAMKEVRIAVKEWSNDEMGLGVVALKGLVTQTRERTSTQLNFNQNSELSEWPIELSIILYRVLQESLTNVLRHSNATIVDVNVEESHDMIYLTVTDNGIKNKEEAITLGYGLNGIIERCKAWGGDCSFSAIEPHGFRVEAMIPVQFSMKKAVQEE